MRTISLPLLFFVSFGASGADTLNARMDQVLQENIVDIQILGVLKFCEKPGLRDPLYQKISSSIVSHSETDAIELLRIADAQASGVKMGLEIAKLDPAGRRRVCDLAVSYVDQVLSQRIEQRGL